MKFKLISPSISNFEIAMQEEWAGLKIDTRYVPLKNQIDVSEHIFVLAHRKSYSRVSTFLWNTLHIIYIVFSVLTNISRFKVPTFVVGLKGQNKGLNSSEMLRYICDYQKSHMQINMHHTWTII